jgi:hypothetical protein
MSLDDMAVMLVNAPSPWGVSILLQLMPSQCSATGRVVNCRAFCEPTAHTSFAETASTPSKLAGLTGVWTTDHALPFQCSASGKVEFLRVVPTVQASFIEFAETA